MDQVVEEEKLKVSLTGELNLQSEYSNNNDLGDEHADTGKEEGKKKKILDLKRIPFIPKEKKGEKDAVKEKKEGRDEGKE